MRIRALLIGMLAAGVTASTSGCVVAESAFITMHTYHGGAVGSEPGEIRAKAPKQTEPQRGPLDVPAEAPTPP
ncbi:MAG TPA: hypothetical protein V6D05_09050 [Stenomitos sp.]